MSNHAPVSRYYPRLSSVVSENDIPDILGFIKTGVVNLLDNVYFKDLQYNKSPKGDSAFYGLSVVSRELKIEIPGTGIDLVLNPDLSGEDNDYHISSFPITIEYQWKILAYLRYFSVGNFSFDAQQIFEVALRVLNISEEQAVSHFVNTFVQPEEQDITPLQQFVRDVNSVNDWDIDIPTAATTLPQVIGDIFERSAGKYASLVAFGTYMATSDLSEASAKVKVYFRSLIPQDIDEFIKDVILPKFRATLLLSAAIEFPRNILKPVYREGTFVGGNNVSFEEIPETDSEGNPKVMLSFAEAFFYADTEKGFGYNMDLVLDLNCPAMIGNTGLIVDIHNLKIDISKTENIAEADADGRPKDFMGVYMEYTEIFLPKKWFRKSGGKTIGIAANNLLVGTGGISGNIGIRATYPTEVIKDKIVIVNYFQKYFDLVYSIKVVGKETAIGSHSELIDFMNNELPSPSMLKFEYPISLKLKGTNEEKEFKTQDEYYQFLKHLNTDIDVFDPNTFLWFDLGDHTKYPEGSTDNKKFWSIGFQKFDIDFYHGKVVHSSLSAALKIEKFKGIDSQGKPVEGPLYIAVFGEWESSDNFKLSAGFPDGLSMRLFDNIILTLQSAELGKRDNNFFIGADTKITFPEESIMYKLTKGKEIDLPAIRIYSNGRFEIAGGVGFIPVNFTLPLGPVEMSVTGLHLGSIQREKDGVIRNYNYVGFDGGLSIDPIGVDVKGNGVKYYYTTDDDETKGYTGDNYLHISTLEIDLIIPGTASESDAVAVIRGSLTLPTPGESDEYGGSVMIKLPKAKIAGEAAMRLNPRNRSFLVKAAVEFPSPIIPLGFLGIYGFAGLIGKKYVADKKVVFPDNADQKTWYDYYMAPEQGIGVDKFRDPTQTGDYANPFSIGIGASLATMADGGRTMSLRAMFLLSLPSMFAIDAGLAILSERLMLTDKKVPPFYAFLIIGDDSLEFGAGANYQLNKSSGWFIDIKAEIQVGFFFKNQRPWYINFGTKEKPITATLFKDILNIKAESYLMISAAGIESGARVGFDFDLYIGRAWVMVEVGTHISFERPQIGGYLYIEGGLKINLWVIQVSIAVSIFFSVELVKPFLIFAQLRVQLRMKICWFIKIRIDVLLTFKWEKNKKVDTTAIAPITFIEVTDDDYPKQVNTDKNVKGIHMLTNESFDIQYLGGRSPSTSIAIDDKYMIPLDTFIDIKMEKGLAPSGLVDAVIGSHTDIANGSIEMIPPQETVKGGLKLRQVKHKYSIEEIGIYIAAGRNWVDYNPYEALFPGNKADNNDASPLKIGHWQRNSDRYDTIRLLATSPFTFMDSGEPGWVIPEQYGITPSTLFCVQKDLQWHTSNFLNIPLGTEYTPPTGYNAYMISGAYYNIEGTYSQTYDVDENGNMVQVISEDKMVVRSSPNPFDFSRSLEFNNGDNLIVTFPEAAVKIELNLTTYSKGVTVNCYENARSNLDIPAYSIHFTKEELANMIEIGEPEKYTSVNETPPSFAKMKIVPEANDKDTIEEVNQEIAAIWAEAAANAGDGVTSIILTREQRARLERLEKELRRLKSEACSDVGCIGLDFLILKDVFVDSVVSSLYNFINDNITFNNCLNELGHSGVLTVDFGSYSVLIIGLTEYVADLGYITNAVKKITNKKDHLCVNIEQESIIHNNPQDPGTGTGTGSTDKGLPYVPFKYSIIRIDKMPAKELKIDYDCGCGDEDDGNGNISVCTTSLQQVRWQTLTEYEYQQSIPGYDAVQENAQATMAAFSKTIQPIWRPNSKFLLHFRLRDEVTFDGRNDTSESFDYYYGFKTMGPVGHFHKQKESYLKKFDDAGDPVLGSDGEQLEYKEEEKAITSLRSYLDYKRSYPNPDGNLMGSKPLFYGHDQCRIDLFFDKAYTSHMFSEWGSYRDLLDPIKMDMPVVIKDPVSEAIVPYPLPKDWKEEDVPGTKYEWADDKDPNLPLGIRTFLEYADPENIPCKIDLGEAIKPNVKMRTVTLTDLKPEKLYTAMVYSAYDANGDGQIKDQMEPKDPSKIKYAESRPVHEFGFITSRYADFREQVMSYQLNEMSDKGNIIESRQAVYEKYMNLSSEQVDNLYSLVSGKPNTATEELRNNYLHEFDRAMEGILQIGPLDPPTHTDFVKIMHVRTQEVIAILVRNPEPFNDPRIPLEFMFDRMNEQGILEEGALKVLGAKGAGAKYKVLWSKDFSQAIIMHDTKKIVAKELQFQFIYKTWDGNEGKYIVKDEKGIPDVEKLNTIFTELITINK
ncbi:MAG: hypothetical protein E2600_10430 [Chryseobacterium sp.]|nr:hypothetical protein [Chryseobacterium sp.]